jgi:hypothetical protein
MPNADSIKRARTFVIIGTVIHVALAALSLVAALTTLFMFDAPGSEKNPYLLTMVWSIWLFPVACAIAIIVGWIAYFLKSLTLARLVFLLPIVNIIVGAIGFVLLSKICHGDFACGYR